MKISLCMIVKDEESLLEKCLQSIHTYVDDIVIVDTGSKDRTKEIAQEYTQKVFDFVWCDDFAAARNFSLSKATHGWVLVLDADEVITSFNKEQVGSVIEQVQDHVGRIERINAMADSNGEKLFFERVNRLFNHNYYLYDGIIHEQVVRKDGLPYEVVHVEITAEHMGYTQEVLTRTDKITRNITLLERALSENPEDTYLLYQLGQSYYLAKDFRKAIEYFQRALRLPINYALEYVGNMVESYGYALINSEHYTEALRLENYAQYYSGSADYQFVMGLVCMNNGMFTKAVECFKKCTGIKESKVEGVNSYLPNYNIGVIFECLGDIDQAKHYYSQCGEYALALNRLELLRQ